MKVIYVDDPLPPKSLTVREKNSMYHSICLKTFLQFPTSNHSVDIGGGESKLYQVVGRMGKEIMGKEIAAKRHGEGRGGKKVK